MPKKKTRKKSAMPAKTAKPKKSSTKKSKRTLPKARPKKAAKRKAGLTKTKKKTTRTIARQKAIAKEKNQKNIAARTRDRGIDQEWPTVEGRDSDAETFARQSRRSEAAGQSGDLQGLSNVEGADSETVDELIEEGNAFEAGVVAGVER